MVDRHGKRAPVTGGAVGIGWPRGADVLVHHPGSERLIEEATATLGGLDIELGPRLRGPPAAYAATKGAINAMTRSLAIGIAGR